MFVAERRLHIVIADVRSSAFNAAVRPAFALVGHGELVLIIATFGFRARKESEFALVLFYVASPGSAVVGIVLACLLVLGLRAVCPSTIARPVVTTLRMCAYAYACERAFISVCLFSCMCT